jgi:hypothetical protein
MKMTFFKCVECGCIFALGYWSVSTTCVRCGGLALVDRNDREDRLRELGVEDVSNEDRKKNLALNVVLSDWPK